MSHRRDAECGQGPLVEVTAPSRLHFGLFSFGHCQGRQFGGVGVMLDKPAVALQIQAAETLETAGPLAEQVREFVSRWAAFHGLAGELPCRIVVQSVAESHVGLGVGTQVGLSVGAGLNIFFQQPQPAPAELALSVGRGYRSAVGTYGFATGGLIVERGKLPNEPIAPLEVRLEPPAHWRFVLLQPRASRGLSGQVEQDAFGSLPPVPVEVTAELVAEVRARMLPAAAAGDFEAFSESVYRYGRLAGLCFASVQGGPYNGPRLSALVDLVRSQGVRGVGQSSWGPTLFAILPDESQARDFVARMTANPACADLQFAVTAPNNRGARLEVCRR
jgi:beta-ribofuranosylaminobenzene 5'-phosphate synthase